MVLKVREYLEIVILINNKFVMLENNILTQICKLLNFQHAKIHRLLPQISQILSEIQNKSQEVPTNKVFK